MINKKTITKIIKKITKREQVIPDQRLMHPKREWSFGLVLFLILVLTGGTYALFAFNSYSGISVDNEVVEVDQLHYKRADALKAIEVYQLKKNVFETELANSLVREAFNAELETETGAESESGEVLEGGVVDQTTSSPVPETEETVDPLKEEVFLE